MGLVQLKKLERNNQKSISHEVNDIFYLLEDISKQYEKIKEVGDEKGITEEYIEALNELYNKFFFHKNI